MYKEKGNQYFSNIRKELLDLIPKENRNGNILEIGAGGGDTLIYAKRNNYAKSIYGIELCKIEGSLQESDELNDFVIGDIEKIDINFNIKFDVIICGDVLEHLVDPYNIISKLKKNLKKDGVIIASLSNIRQIFILKDILINGDFRYTDAGILDKTHLRFFCKKNMINLFEDNNLIVKKIISNSNLIGKTTKKINKLTFNIFDEFLAVQYYLVVGQSC